MTLSMRTLKIAAIALAFLLLAVLAYPGIRSLDRMVGLFSGKQEEPGIDLSTPQGAAALSLQAYYWRDFMDGTPQEWAARVCAVSTDNGCREAQAMASALWEGLVLPEQVRTFAMAVPVRQARTYDKLPGVQAEIWEMQVTLSDPWISTDNPFPVYVLVAKLEGKSRWGMEHVLNKEDLEFIENNEVKQ